MAFDPGAFAAFEFDFCEFPGEFFGLLGLFVLGHSDRRPGWADDFAVAGREC